MSQVGVDLPHRFQRRGSIIGRRRRIARVGRRTRRGGTRSTGVWRYVYRAIDEYGLLIGSASVPPPAGKDEREGALRPT